MAEQRTLPDHEPGDGFAVPPVLRGFRFVPRQAPGKRQPARVTPGAFRAAGLPVPENPAQQNAYQLSRRQGVPWSPGIDRHIARRGGELLGGDRILCLDIDVTLAVDGTVWADGLRRLADLATARGEVLDMTGCMAVRTPGNGGSHAPGWHLWYRAPADPVQLGALGQDRRAKRRQPPLCPQAELKSRATCPGSPGYVIRSVPPGALPVLPGWIARLAGPPPEPVTIRPDGNGADPWNRLHGILGSLLSAGEGERNRLLYWASTRAGELVAAGSLEQDAVVKTLRDAAADLGLVAEDGEGAVLATIASGLRQAVTVS